MSIARLLGIGMLTSALLFVSRNAAATTYIFATFKGDDAAGMKLSIYTSTDSTSFTLLSDTGFGGNTTYLRDPSIMKYSDGKYYIAYTDPMTASCCNPEDHFGIAVSSDLKTWTDLTTVKAGVPSVSHVWAPEWFVEGNVIHVIANIDTGNADFQPYVFTAQNSALTSWSGPTALGIGADYIDTYVAKLGSTYHAYIKSEVTRYLEHATAPSLTGPWTFVGKNDWAGWGSGREGPAIVQLDDGRYRMYVDPQQGGMACQTMTSTDLNTWSAMASIPNPAGSVIRHGTVIRDITGIGSNGYFTAAGGGSIGGAISSGGASGGGTTGKGGVSAAGGSAVKAGAPSTGGTAQGGVSYGSGSTSAATGGAKATTGGTASSGGTIGNGGGSLVLGGAIGLNGGSDGMPPAMGGIVGTATGTGGSSSASGGTPDAGASAGRGGLSSAITTLFTSAGTSDARVATDTPSAESCGCRVADGASSSSILSAFGALGVLLLRSRRRRKPGQTFDVRREDRRKRFATACLRYQAARPNAGARRAPN